MSIYICTHVHCTFYHFMMCDVVACDLRKPAENAARTEEGKVVFLSFFCVGGLRRRQRAGLLCAAARGGLRLCGPPRQSAQWGQARAEWVAAAGSFIVHCSLSRPARCLLRNQQSIIPIEPVRLLPSVSDTRLCLSVSVSQSLSR